MVVKKKKYKKIYNDNKKGGRIDIEYDNKLMYLKGKTYNHREFFHELKGEWDKNLKNWVICITNKELLEQYLKTNTIESTWEKKDETMEDQDTEQYTEKMQQQPFI